MNEKRIERFLISLAAIGLIAKIIHLPFAGFMLTLSLCGLSIFYFLNNRRGIIGKDVARSLSVLSLAGTIFFSIVPIGILFKLQHWPMRQAYLAIGAIGCVAIFALTYFSKTGKTGEGNNSSSKNLRRSGFLAVIAVFFYLLPSSVLVQMKHWNDPEMARLTNQYYEHPENKEYKQELDDYVSKKDSLKLFKASEWPIDTSGK